MGAMSEGHTKEPIEAYTSHSNRLTRGRLIRYPVKRGRFRGVSEGSDSRESDPYDHNTSQRVQLTTPLRILTSQRVARANPLMPIRIIVTD